MKYTILGFNQQGAIEEGLDLTDLSLLAWVRDLMASPSARTREQEGLRFVWVCYAYLLEDMPIVRITKRTLRWRFRKLADCGLLYHLHDKEGGSWSFYALTPRAMRLMYNPSQSNAHPWATSCPPLGNQLPTKYPSTINPSTTIIDNKKETNGESGRARLDFLKTGRIS